MSAGTLVVLCLVLLAGLKTGTSAQSEPRALSQLLLSLQERSANEPGFVIVFQFAVPLSSDGDTSWEVPYDDSELSIRRRFAEIGQDFVCFYEVAGQAPIMTCTPFTNIVSVGYLETP